MNVLRNSLSIEERSEFVNNVYDLSVVGGEYNPALYDYSFRINFLIFFTDIMTEDKSQDELSNMAFSEETDELIFKNTKTKNIANILNKACREKVEIEKQKWMINYEAEKKNQIFEFLANILTDISNTIDPVEVMKKAMNDKSKTKESV